MLFGNGLCSEVDISGRDTSRHVAPRILTVSVPRKSFLRSLACGNWERQRRKEKVGLRWWRRRSLELRWLFFCPIFITPASAESERQSTKHVNHAVVVNRAEPGQQVPRLVAPCCASSPPMSNDAHTYLMRMSTTPLARIDRFGSLTDKLWNETSGHRNANPRVKNFTYRKPDLLGNTN